MRSALATSLLVLVIAACGGDDLLLPSSGQPARIEIVTGDGQTGTVGQPLGEPLVVRVSDPEDRPVANVAVAFVTPPGATLTPNDTVVTGADGTATVFYVLAPASGEQAIEARAQPVVPSPSLTTTFRAIADPEPAVELIAVRGNQQEAEVLTALPDSLVVKAVDHFGNGVAGVEVTWSPSDGTVSPTVVTTGTDGQAATLWTLGSRPGVSHTSAAAPDLAGSPLAFDATGVAPPTPQLVLVTQPSSSARAGVPFERQPEIQLQDAVGAPLARGGVSITVQIADGGGSLGGTTTIKTNDEGHASFTNLSIRGEVGERTLLFAAVDFTPTSSDEIAVKPGDPSARESSASVPDGKAGEKTTISLRIKDDFGNPVEQAGDAIELSIGGANAGTEVTVTEKDDGEYSASYTPVHSGVDQVIVRIGESNVEGTPASSTVAPGAADANRTTVRINREGIFTIKVLVTARDAQGNLLGHGGDAVKVQLNGGRSWDAIDNGDGTYSMSFAPVLGFSVVVTLNGNTVAGSPFTREL
jgi:hypothetical protein